MRQLLTKITSARFVRRWGPVVVVCIPIAFAALRAAIGRWVPAGDDAYFTVRSRDVLTVNHPLLGAWSSGSIELDTPINNLGPVQPDLLAVFTRFTPMGGTAVGVAVINIAAIVMMSWAIVRTVGERAVLPAMCAVGLLTWTMGSEMLITPRQHQFLIITFLCLLVAAWAVAAGDRWAIVVAVVAASLAAQTHLSYIVLVSALSIVMIVGQILTTRAGQARGGTRPFVVSAVVAVALWVQTLIDQFFGYGNLGHVLTGSGGAGRSGLSVGVRIVSGILVSPYTLVRPGYKVFGDEADLGSNLQVVVLVVAVVTAAGAVVWWWRRAGWRAVSGPSVALVAVLAGVVDAAMLPYTRFGYATMNYRWLWAVGAFIMMLALIAGERWASGRSEGWAHTATWSLAVLVMVPAFANLPRSIQVLDADRYMTDQISVVVVLDQLEPIMDDIADHGPVLIDDADMYFGHPYTYTIMAAMQEHGIDFRFESPVQERRFGKRRVSDGTETQMLRMVSGGPGLDLQNDPNLVAFVGGDRPVAFVLERS